MKKNTTWQLQDAKAMLSKVIKASSLKPQTITVRGKETSVILSIEKYKKLVSPKKSLYEFIQDSPLCDVNLDLPKRLPDKPRVIDL